MTTGQYCYLIVEKLRQFISCSSSGARAYLYNLCGKIFKDPGI